MFKRVVASSEGVAEAVRGTSLQLRGDTEDGESRGITIEEALRLG